MGMKPIVSLVTEVEVATEVAAVAGVAAAGGAGTVVDAAAVDGAMTTDGACHPMGILGWLRLQVSTHHCGRNKEIGLMDRH